MSNFTATQVTASKDPLRIKSLYFTTSIRDMDLEPAHFWKSKGFHIRESVHEDYFKTKALSLKKSDQYSSSSILSSERMEYSPTFSSTWIKYFGNKGNLFKWVMCRNGFVNPVQFSIHVEKSYPRLPRERTITLLSYVHYWFHWISL